MRVLCLVACVALLAAPVSAEVDFDGNRFQDSSPVDGPTLPAPPPHRVDLFDNEADFLTAAGDVTTQDFEAEATTADCESGAAEELVFTGFTVGSTPAAMKVLEIPCFGNHNTTPGGVKYLGADTDMGGVSAEVVFLFAAPIRALGLYITDLDTASMQITILGAGYAIEPHGDGGETYFGIIEDDEFTSVLVQIVQESDSHFSFDDISYGAGLSPVETATWGSVMSSR